MLTLRRLSQERQHVSRQRFCRQYSLARSEKPNQRWASEHESRAARLAEWKEQAGRIKAGAQQSMLSLLEERGFVKDVAGGRDTLDWVLTEKRIGVYVGVDPTAPSLHVGHLLPLMALYWMYLHGYYTVSLLGGGTVQIGDPSGRTTARARQAADVRTMQVESINRQLTQLWTNVRCLGIKHQYAPETSRKRQLLNNSKWLENLSAVELMRDLGSGMRLGTMLSRDSVKMRMESGEGMSISEFSYPLFQAYDWWHMYDNNGVQLQIGGSDQYGNICAGMNAVSHMRNIHHPNALQQAEPEPLRAAYGLTTPLLTTASGEKFGKSAGNAVWLDKTMMNSFDLYQYFMRTADADIERYLKLFTFLPLDEISLLVEQQRKDASKRIAQHVLAKEVVELAHGAQDAKVAETAHREAFSHGTNTFALGALRKILGTANPNGGLGAQKQRLTAFDAKLLKFKQEYAASSTVQPTSSTSTPISSQTKNDSVVHLPLSILKPGAFPRVLHAAGLASTKSEAHRLIASKGAYVVVPNSSSQTSSTSLKWAPIEASSEANPEHYLIDFEALVLRSGKSKIQVVKVVSDAEFEKYAVEAKAKKAQEKSEPEAKEKSEQQVKDKLEQEAKDDAEEEQSKSAETAEAVVKTPTGEAVPSQPS
ncbi:tyrosyl-tRNA synthetase-like protein [Boeremia exigua]|uniref:tyrosyl-tRNA synthetase-like protein n=1 Tax=Boeremia exigua TaxID=749465 RepID=UPI001E8CFDDE|nr:tyrosyl-tRNA synthetase-like protein [Boeremia exigua]KAH6620436.1 tyrosyl-tRNA synthetase-like protein [Boeremia exigua]